MLIPCSWSAYAWFLPFNGKGFPKPCLRGWFCAVSAVWGWIWALVYKDPEPIICIKLTFLVQFPGIDRRPFWKKGLWITYILQECIADADCIYVDNGCCDCANGGMETAINSTKLSSFKSLSWDGKTPSPLGEHFSIPLAWNTAKAHIRPMIWSIT